ncbi:MAG: Cobalamin [Proteobacteria bacterium]|nr:Cobalamin [Pseudomonadota bacterium]
MTTALVLFAHGARDPEWANPMRRVQAAIQQRMTAIPVELAFLEFMSPTLSEQAADLVARGAERIVVIPMFIARGGHLKKEAPDMIEALRARYPDVRFELGNAIGEHELVVQAMATATLEVAGL